MKNIFLILSIFGLISCSNNGNRVDCSNAFATVILTQEDVDSQIEKRKHFDISNDLQKLITSKTTELLIYFDEYEKNIFHTLKLEKPSKYNFDWCLELKSNNNYKILTVEIIGEPCDLKKGQYSLLDLYTNISTYNSTLDQISNTNYCKDNHKFSTIMDPENDNCIYESDRFFNMNLNNHLIGLLRLKEAILTQEELLIEKTKTLPNKL